MSGDVANPRVWTGCDAYVGPLGTTAPTDITTALNAAFLPFGLLSEDGLTETRAQDTTDFYAWGGIYVRTVRSKFKRQIKITALEDNPVVWGLVNPGSTSATATGITTRTVKSPSGSNPQAFVLQLVDGTVTTRRVIPKGEVIEVADVKLSDTDMSAYELTINVYSDGSGVLYKDITNDPQADDS